MTRLSLVPDPRSFRHVPRRLVDLETNRRRPTLTAGEIAS